LRRQKWRRIAQVRTQSIAYPSWRDATPLYTRAPAGVLAAGHAIRLFLRWVLFFSREL
jgi:hypothetical protein